MGREARRVPANWVHPKNEKGNHEPLMESGPPGSWVTDQKRWHMEALQWLDGRHEDQLRLPEDTKEFSTLEEWAGSPNAKDCYMPEWPESERTHWQMYEDTSEGTPISPIFASVEELARWLADNGASVFADMTQDYEGWLQIIDKPGYAIPVFRIPV